MVDWFIDIATFNLKAFCVVFWVLITVQSLTLRIGQLLPQGKKSYFSEN